ncbi:uncharacterized protein K444DRAFT_699188 [Hyaloscypha bicolor E]|uniref:Uncharacterized protein n=1 Tax=Hyaloscypha bicolor E TaxID=1095630 RepID=A0A2J6SUG4_9HELO|nr:uncharacterized protein K444DRAFT_699188 [Hyaloscypha bicolor E]PMD54406.1 hypothetical protein K444DRAFT_699188 [Hyaloscypha bicolor E]
MSYISGRSFALPTNTPLNNVLSSSSSPFHDCMESENAIWTDCRAAAGLTAQSTGSSTVVVGGLNTRALLPFHSIGTIIDLGQKLGGSEQCYSVNDLGATGWLTTTAVAGLKTKICTAAVNGAIASGRGCYNEPHGGFTQQGAGPVATSKVNLYLDILLTGAQALDPTIDITQLAIDLCEKGIDHLTGDKGCTAQRKAGVIVSHNSVNGGAIDWAPNGQTPQFDNTGVNCGNCFMNMIMEASSIVDKDGKTGIPEDAPPS